MTNHRPDNGGSNDANREALPWFGQDYYQYLVRLLPSLRTPDDTTAIPTAEPTWGGLLALELAVLDRLSESDLAREAPLLRERLRNILGDREYAATVGSIPPPAPGEGKSPPSPADRRDELRFLVREVYKRYSLTGSREAFRNRILIHVLIILVVWVVILLLLLVALFGLAKAIAPMGLLVIGPMALGSVGAYLSLLFRLQSAPYTGDPLFRMLSVSKGFLAVYAAPVIGSVLAAVGVCLFATNLVQGDAFPDFKEHFALNEGSGRYEEGKLAVWAFVIGFAERYVPDALNRIIQARRDQVVEMFRPVAGSSTSPAAGQRTDTGSTGS